MTKPQPDLTCDFGGENFMYLFIFFFIKPPVRRIKIHFAVKMQHITLKYSSSVITRHTYFYAVPGM